MQLPVLGTHRAYAGYECNTVLPFTLKIVIFTLLCQGGLLTTGSRLPVFQDVSDTSPSHFTAYIPASPGDPLGSLK